MKLRRLVRVAGAVAVVLLLAPPVPRAAEPRSSDPRLSATLVGRLEPGTACPVAVRWDGPTGALFDAWVDLDGDGFRSPDEIIAQDRPLRTGIEVVGFEVTAGAVLTAEPKVWIKARRSGRDDDKAAPPSGASLRGARGCSWQPGFALPDLDGTVTALTVVDDGSGPALYAGGDFHEANGVLVNHVARWDGETWSGMSGPSAAGTSDRVYALAGFDDGSGPALYAGGWFQTAGGVTVNYIARWDGIEWSPLSGPLGTGTSFVVYTLVVFDDGSGPALYAGGDFATAGGVTVNRVARWDGREWSALAGPSGTGTNDGIHALAVVEEPTGPALYVGGRFTTAGGVTTNRVARWDGSEWSALTGPSGTGVNNSVYTIVGGKDGSGLAAYVGGRFSTAGGVTVGHVARWDGTDWSALAGPSGTGVDGDVHTLAVLETGEGQALYAGGRFGRAGGLRVDHVARWDGSAWSPVSGPSGPGTEDWVHALAVFDDGLGPTLYAGGEFTAAGGAAVNYVARWVDPQGWSSLSGPPAAGLNGTVKALTLFDDGSGPELYAGGDFTGAGGVTVNRIARWDGSAWSPLSGPAGNGVEGGYEPTVQTLEVFDDGSGPALFVGGRFETAGGVTVNNIARWDGNAWSDLSGPSGTGTGGIPAAVFALEVFDDGSGPQLYAGGEFSWAGGVTASKIARWDGARWWAVGPGGGLDDTVRAFAVYDDGSGPALFAGGDFGQFNHVVRWNGSAWSPLTGPSDTGTSGSVEALTVFDDGQGPALYAGGRFDTAGGVIVHFIARWDGGSWSDLSGPFLTGVQGWPVSALAVFDDGSGPALYAGGAFYLAGGVVVKRIARWDGSAWSELFGPTDTGTNAEVTALLAVPDSAAPALYVGGSFTTSGGLPSSGIGVWSCQNAVFLDGFEDGSTSAWSLAVP